MKVYLINPPAVNGVEIVREGRCMQRKGAWTAVWSPISLALCAAVLEKDKFKVKLSDCIVEKINNQSLIRKIKSFKPNFIVVNTSTPSIESDLTICDLIKQNNPKIKIAVIGIHVTALPKESLKMSAGLDFVIRNEPEYTVLELAQKIRLNKSFDKVLGITWKKGKKIQNNPDRHWIQNLDELPFPAWHLIDKNNYIMPFTNKPFFLVATGRGCPYRCTYCADHTYYGRILRLRSPKNIVDELEYSQKVYGVSDFLFWTESFTINQIFATSVCDEIIARNLKVRWVCNSRVDDVNLNLLKKFKKAGCTMIGFGIESGNQAIIDNIKKGITLRQSKQAVNWSHKAGLEVTGHSIIGLPGETKRTAHQTVKFAKELKLDFVQFYCAVPFPGSELYTQAKECGWITESDWTQYEQNFSILNYPNLSAKQIMTLRQEAYKSFYLSPKIIIKTLLKLRSPKEVLNFFTMAKAFMEWIK